MHDAMDWARIAQGFFWPGVVVIGFLWFFRHPIAKFLSEVTKLNIGPASAERPTPDQANPPGPPPGGHPPESPPPAASPPDSAQIEQLRPYVYWWFFEKTFRLIFSTQLEVLRILNESPAGADADKLVPFFARHLALREAHGVKPATISFSDYMGFLIKSGLVSLDPNGTYQITPLGKSFRQWMIDENLSSNELL
jgi:hypothetical protein